MLDRSYTLSLEFPHSMSTGYPQTKNEAASEVGVSNILRLRYTFAYLRSWEAHRSQLRERNSQDDQMACPYRSRIVCARDIHTSTRRAALETWQIKPQPFRTLLSAQQRGVSGGNAKCRAVAKSCAKTVPNNHVQLRPRNERRWGHNRPNRILKNRCERGPMLLGYGLN